MSSYGFVKEDIDGDFVKFEDYNELRLKHDILMINYRKLQEELNGRNMLPVPEPI